MSKTSQPYCKAALFRCTCCCYEAEIYAADEWIKKSDIFICSTCKKAYNNHFDTPIIYRSDIDDEIPLHLQVAEIPSDYLCCTECSGIENLHWKELLVHCPNCNEDYNPEMPNTMVFEKYIIGKDIIAFYEYCCEIAKPSHPILQFINSKGHILMGPFSEFSAS